MLIREKAVQIALTQKGVHETGESNWGPKVKEYLASTKLNFAAAWCMAFAHWCFEQAGVVLGGGASVGNFEAWGRANGDVVTRPRRGDLGCWDLTGDGWPDHVFFVVKVLRLGPLWRLATIEGNTSADAFGSQDNGGGVYPRTRIVLSSKVNGAVFVRIPGETRPVHLPTPAKPKPKPKPKKPAPPPRAASNSTSRKGDRGDRVRTLQRFLKHAGARIVVDGVYGPSTVASVRAFQKRHGLKADGICGQKTWKALNAEL